ncbi:MULTISPECIES: hypothetical protein [unclassified Blastococcus]
MRVRALALAGLSAVALTACGATEVAGSARPAADAADGAEVGHRTGPELADAAATALEHAGSVRVQGTVGMHGGKVDADMRLQGDDVDAIMDLDGTSMRLVLTDGELFVRASAGFWAAQGLPEPVVTQVAGAWARTPADPLLGAEEMTLAVLAAEVRSPTGATIADEVTAGEVDGRPVWLVEASDGSVTSVAAEGTPYPLLLTTPGMGTARLSAFGSVEPVVAPADFVDLGS